jgi:hypothetical protein
MRVGDFPLVRAYSFMARHGFSAEAAAIREDGTDYGRARTSRLKRARVVALIIENDLLSAFISEAWPDGSTKRGTQLVAQMRRLHDEYQAGWLSPTTKIPVPPMSYRCPCCGERYEVREGPNVKPCPRCGASAGEQAFREIAIRAEEPARIREAVQRQRMAHLPDTIEVQYSGHREFNTDRARRERDGWHVIRVQEVKQPAGLGRIVTLGLGALVVKPKPQFYVTYGKGGPTGKK